VLPASMSCLQAEAISVVCMNFLAMFMSKNWRVCFAEPISMMAFFLSNFTFESARVGTSNFGPCFLAASEKIMSATASILAAVCLARGDCFTAVADFSLAGLLLVTFFATHLLL